MKTWVLVAHGSAAKVIEVDRSSQQLKCVKEFEHPETALKDSEIHTDKPGRTFQSAFPMRHAKENNEDPTDHERRVFAKKICDFLEKSYQENTFDNLILVSSPHLLGLIRKTMSTSLSKILAHEISKDLASLNLKDQEVIDKIKKNLDILII